MVKHAENDHIPFTERACLFAKKHSFLITLFVGACGIRFVVFALYHADFWYKTCLIDDCLFYSWAHDIISGDFLGLRRGVFRMNPGYPYTLALIYFIFGKAFYAPHCVQYIVGAVNVLLMYMLTTQLFNRKTGVVAGILAAVYGMSVFYQGKLLGPVWINFFNLCMLLFLLYGVRLKRNSFFFAAGAMLGISSLYLPTVVLFMPCVALWIALQYRGALWNQMARWGSQVGLFFCGIAVIMLPVLVRNAVVDKSFGLVLTTSSGGINFYIGNNPEADGYNAWPSFIRYSPDSMHDDFKSEAAKRTGKELTDSEVSSYWFNQSVRWLIANPKRAFWLYRKKFIYFWNAIEPPDNFMMDNVRKFTRIFGIPLLRWGILAPFCMLAIFLCLYRKKGMLLLLYMGTYMGINLLFYILSRYRFPAVIGLIPLAAYSMVWLSEQMKQKRWKQGAAGLVSLTVLFAFVYKPVVLGEIEWSKQYSIGVIYNNRGRVPEAIEAYKISIALNPQFSPSRTNLANIYLTRKEYRLAIEHYTVAAQLSEKDAPRIHHIIGEIYLYYLKEFENAESALQNAVALGEEPALLTMSELYIQQERYQDALTLLTQLAIQNPGDHRIPYKLGLVHLHTNAPYNAKGYFEQTLLLKPDFQDAHGALNYLQQRGIK